MQIYTKRAKEQNDNREKNRGFVRETRALKRRKGRQNVFKKNIRFQNVFNEYICIHKILIHNALQQKFQRLGGVWSPVRVWSSRQKTLTVRWIASVFLLKYNLF